MCVRTSVCLTPLCHPAGTQTLQQGRKDSVCVIFPLYLTTIFHCSMTFTNSTLQTSVQLPMNLAASHSSVPQNPQMPLNLDLNVNVTNSKSSVFPTIFSTCTASNQSFSSNLHLWPQMEATSYFPDPNLLSRHWTMHVLVKLDPQTQTVNFCLAQNHQIANVSTNFRVQSDFKVSFLLLRIFRSAG